MTKNIIYNTKTWPYSSLTCTYIFFYLGQSFLVTDQGVKQIVNQLLTNPQYRVDQHSRYCFVNRYLL